MQFRYFYNNQLTHFVRLLGLCRSQWPRGLMSAAASLLRLWVRIPPAAWNFVCRECCVLSGRGFCDELITRPEKSYRLWCVVQCDLETSWMRRPWPTGGCRANNKQTNKENSACMPTIYDQLTTELALRRRLIKLGNSSPSVSMNKIQVIASTPRCA